MNDIALSKPCAWREKDRAWLHATHAAGLLDMAAVWSRGGLLDGPAAVTVQKAGRRADVIASRRLPGTEP